MDELKQAIKYLKTNKRPGKDGILNEQQKNLPPAELYYLKRLLNYRANEKKKKLF